METTELRDYIKPLLRWWWLLALSVLVAVASSAFFAVSQPEQYQSRATIMVGGSIRDPNPDNSGLYIAQQLITTYTDLIVRDTIRQPTMEALGLTWLPEYTARAVPNTQLMELSVIDTDPMRAQAVANELIRQLILASPAGSDKQHREDFINAQLDELQAGIEQNKEEIARKQDELVDLFSARQIADTQSQIQALEDKVAIMQTNFTNLLATTQKGAVNTISVIEAPRAGTPIAGKIWLTLLTAAAIGFVLAAMGAYLIEYLDDTLKNSDDVQKKLGIAAVGAIPILDGKEDENLIMLERTHSPAAEAYRVLRTNLQYASVANKLDILMITSPSPREGKSTTAANLAVALGQSGRNVVLIDADMHRPRQHRLFQLVNNIGLTSVLLGDPKEFNSFLQPTKVPTLRVLTTGPLAPNPAELLGSQRMYELLNRVKEQADIVIVDSPPATAVADTAVLSTQVDGVLLVLYAGRTSGEMAKRAKAALDQVGGRLVGVVLNRMPTRGSSYYYYYYNYYRRYYRRDDEISSSSAQATPPKPFTKNRQKDSYTNGNGTDVILSHLSVKDPE
ncbi:MAG: polysaccharide biosynthesis tyrosine autokinase [Caldilineaceae bacterium]|nr:polysaccharide biosynthesis tyrosine autokinase [Caldilineaceae bacterium]